MADGWIDTDDPAAEDSGWIDVDAPPKAPEQGAFGRVMSSLAQPGQIVHQHLKTLAGLPPEQAYDPNVRLEDIVKGSITDIADYLPEIPIPSFPGLTSRNIAPAVGTVAGKALSAGTDPIVWLAATTGVGEATILKQLASRGVALAFAPSLAISAYDQFKAMGGEKEPREKAAKMLGGIIDALFATGAAAHGLGIEGKPVNASQARIDIEPTYAKSYPIEPKPIVPPVDTEMQAAARPRLPERAGEQTPIEVTPTAAESTPIEPQPMAPKAETNLPPEEEGWIDVDTGPLDTRGPRQEMIVTDIKNRIANGDLTPTSAIQYLAENFGIRRGTRLRRLMSAAGYPLVGPLPPEEEEPQPVKALSANASPVASHFNSNRVELAGQIKDQLDWTKTYLEGPLAIDDKPRIAKYQADIAALEAINKKVFAAKNLDDLVAAKEELETFNIKSSRENQLLPEHNPPYLSELRPPQYSDVVQKNRGAGVVDVEGVGPVALLKDIDDKTEANPKILRKMAESPPVQYLAHVFDQLFTALQGVAGQVIPEYAGEVALTKLTGISPSANFQAAMYGSQLGTVSPGGGLLNPWEVATSFNNNLYKGRTVGELSVRTAADYGRNKLGLPSKKGLDNPRDVANSFLDYIIEIIAHEAGHGIGHSEHTPTGLAPKLSEQAHRVYTQRLVDLFNRELGNSPLINALRSETGLQNLYNTLIALRKQHKILLQNVVKKPPISGEIKLKRPQGMEPIKSTKGLKNETTPEISEGESKVHGVVDPRLIEELASTLYKGDLGEVIVKEGLQNAVDAIPKGTRGKIDVKADFPNRVIAITDNGIGMTPEVASKEFLNPGASYKPEGTRGGFGIAKIALIGNSESINMVTVANVKGSKVQTSISGSGKDWLNREAGFQRNIKVVPKDTPTGTSVVFKIKPGVQMEEYYTRAFAEKFLKGNRVNADFNIQTKAPGFNDFIPVEARKEEYDYRLKKNIPYQKPEDIATVDLPNGGGTVTIRGSKSLVEKTYIPVQILNNGLPQFSVEINIPNGIKIPRELEADVSAAVPPTDSRYPFTPNRQELRDEAKKTVIDFINKELISALAEKHQNALKESLFKGGKINSRQYFVDPTGSLPKDLVQKVANRPYLGAIGALLNGHANNIIRHLRGLGVKIKAPIIHGVGFSPEWYGINLSGPHIKSVTGEQGLKEAKFLGSAVPNRVLVNLWLGVKRAEEIGGVRFRAGNPLAADEVPELAARKIWGTMAHEIIHQLVRAHDEDFSSELTHKFPYMVSHGEVLVRKLANILRKPGVLEEIMSDYEELQNAATEGEDVFGSAGTSSGAKESSPEDDLTGGGAGGNQPTGVTEAGGGGVISGVAGGPESGAVTTDLLKGLIKFANKPLTVGGQEGFYGYAKNVNAKATAIYMAHLAGQVTTGINNLINAGLGYQVAGTIADTFLMAATKAGLRIPIGGKLTTKEETAQIGQEAARRLFGRVKSSPELYKGIIDAILELAGQEGKYGNLKELREIGTKLVPEQLSARAFHLFSNEVPIPGTDQTRPLTRLEKYTRLTMAMNLIQEVTARNYIARVELQPFLKREGLANLEELGIRAESDPEFKERAAKAMAEALSEALKITMAEGPTSANPGEGNPNAIAFDTKTLTKFVNMLPLPAKVFLTKGPFTNYLFNNMPQMFWEESPLSAVYLTRRIKNSLQLPEHQGKLEATRAAVEDASDTLQDAIATRNEDFKAAKGSKAKRAAYENHRDTINAARSALASAKKANKAAARKVEGVMGEGIRSKSQIASHLAWAPIFVGLGMLWALYQNDPGLTATEKEKGEKKVKNFGPSLGSHLPYFSLGHLLGLRAIGKGPKSADDYKLQWSKILENLTGTRTDRGIEALLEGPATRTAWENQFSQMAYDFGKGMIRLGPFTQPLKAAFEKAYPEEAVERAGNQALPEDIHSIQPERLGGFRFPEKMVNLSAFVRGAKSNFPVLSQELPPKYNPASGEVRKVEEPWGNLMGGKVTKLEPVERFINAHPYELAPNEVFARQTESPQYNMAMYGYIKKEVPERVLPIIQRDDIPDNIKIALVKREMLKINQEAANVAKKDALEVGYRLPASVASTLAKEKEDEEMRKADRFDFRKRRVAPESRINRPTKQELEKKGEKEWKEAK